MAGPSHQSRVVGALWPPRRELSLAPSAESQRTSLAQQIGADGLHLLQALEQADAPGDLKEISSVQVLRQVWHQYYDLAGGQARWRAGPQAKDKEGIIRSPYDVEAQTGKKREVTWLGYKVHLTETCALEEGEQAEAAACPHLIVQVQTTVAPVQDVEMTATIQEELATRDLLPEEQFVDTGYVDAQLLVSSQQKHGIRLVGPVLADNSWQAKEGRGFDVAHFQLDWQNQQATCPQGHLSSRWSVAGERMEVVFPQRSVLSVPCAGSVPTPKRRAGCCTCVRRKRMRRCMRDDMSNKRRSFGKNMRHELGWKQRCRKPYEGKDYDEPATMVSTRPSCSTS